MGLDQFGCTLFLGWAILSIAAGLLLGAFIYSGRGDDDGMST